MQSLLAPLSCRIGATKFLTAISWTSFADPGKNDAFCSSRYDCQDKYTLASGHASI
jgi:hypothetical protein